MKKRFKVDDKRKFYGGIFLLIIFISLTTFTWDKAHYLFWNKPILSILNLLTILASLFWGLILVGDGRN